LHRIFVEPGLEPRLALLLGQQLGILFFILIFSFVFYNDLTRVLS